MYARVVQDVRAALMLMSALALAVVIGFTRQAWADDEQQDGPIVAISPDGGELHADVAHDEGQADPEPAYWLGIQGQPLDSAVLRTHLQLADEVGVVVEDVVKDSPAEKAGLRRHDVLIDVNGEQISVQREGLIETVKSILNA